MSEEMTPQRWAELDALFDEALSLAASEREAFMARVELERPQLALSLSMPEIRTRGGAFVAVPSSS